MAGHSGSSLVGFWVVRLRVVLGFGLFEFKSGQVSSYMVSSRLGFWIGSGFESSNFFIFESDRISNGSNKFYRLSRILSPLFTWHWFVGKEKKERKKGTPRASHKLCTTGDGAELIYLK